MRRYKTPDKRYKMITSRPHPARTSVIGIDGISHYLYTMRYTLLLLLIIAALHSGCQTSTAQRDKMIADSVKSFAQRMNPYSKNISAVVLKVDPVSQKELIMAVIETSNDSYNSAKKEVDRSNKTVDYYTKEMTTDKEQLETDKQKHDTKMIVEDEGRVKTDSDELADLTTSPEYQQHRSLLARLTNTRDSLTAQLATADGAKKEHYKALVQLTFGKNEHHHVLIYLDSRYNIVCGKKLEDERDK